MQPGQSPIRAELDRVGASYHLAGPVDYISVQLRLDEVKLPRLTPRTLSVWR